MVSSLKISSGGVLPGLFGGLALLGVLGFGVWAVDTLGPLPQEKPLVAEQATPPRFIHASQGKSGLYLVTDTKTGKKYLWAYHGGIIEVAD